MNDEERKAHLARLLSDAERCEVTLRTAWNHPSVFHAMSEETRRAIQAANSAVVNVERTVQEEIARLAAPDIVARAERAEAEVATLRSMLAEAEADRNNWRAWHGEWKTKAEALKADVEALRMDRDDWKKACDVNAETVLSCVGERDELKAEVKKLKAEVKKLTEDRGHLKNAISARDKEIERLTKGWEGADAEVARIKAAVVAAAKAPRGCDLGARLHSAGCCDYCDLTRSMLAAVGAGEEVLS